MRKRERKRNGKKEKRKGGSGKEGKARQKGEGWERGVIKYCMKRFHKAIKKNEKVYHCYERTNWCTCNKTG